MKTYQKIISIALSIISLFVMFGVSAQASTLPTSVPSIYETYLANQQQIGDVTLVLANGTLRDGTTFTGYQCVTIDSNTPTTEYECGMASGTVMTSLTRGIAAVDGISTSSSLIFAHRRGADVKVSDYPVLTQLDRISNGIDTFPNPISYASNIGTSSLQANTQNLATVGYVNNTAFSGAGVVNATNGASGVVQLSTGTQAAAGTKLGSTGASLALTSAIASSTASTTASIVVVTSSSTGKIDPSFITSTFVNATFTGSTTLGSTTTIGQTYAFNIGKSIWFQNTAGTYTFTMPTGINTAKVMLAGAGGGGGGTCSGGGSCSYAFGAGGYGASCYGYFSTTTPNATYTIVLGSGGGAGNSGFGAPGGNGSGGGTSYMSSVCTVTGGGGASPQGFGGDGSATASSSNSSTIVTLGNSLGLSKGGYVGDGGTSAVAIIEW